MSPQNVLIPNWHIPTGSLGHLTTVNDEQGRKGILKLARDRSDKKLVEPFNEILCNRFSADLGTSTTEVYLVVAGGEPGVVSLVLSELNFSYLQSNNVTLSQSNVQYLAGQLVVDMRRANTDRQQGKNEHVVVIKTGDGVLLCPIDYSHALNGCSGEMFTLASVTDTTKIPVSNYNHIAGPYIRSFSDLKPAITRITAIGDGTIAQYVSDAVNGVAISRPEPEVAFLRSNAAVVEALLKVRRDGLGPSMKEWCRLKGKSLE